MVLRKCEICNYSTSSKFNFEKHLRTKKHLHKISESSKNEQKNVEKCGKNVEKCGENVEKSSDLEHNRTKKSPKKSSDLKCKFCCKMFSRSDSLQRHISICKLNIAQNCSILLLKNVENEIQYNCTYCDFKTLKKFNLTRHYEICKNRKSFENEEIKRLQKIITEKEHIQQLVEKDLEKEKAVNQEKDKTIEIAKKSKQVINNINTTNKTINYLNNTYGDMIAMEQFLYNLEHTEQLTQEEREKLLISFKDSGIELFARSFSHIMKENCRRQLLKEGLPDMGLIPLYCSDGNLRSHKEKGDQGWNTKYDDHILNKMINISTNQVFQSYRKPLVIFGKDRNKVFKQLKQDNHSKNEKKKEIDNE